MGSWVAAHRVQTIVTQIVPISVSATSIVTIEATAAQT